MARFLAPPAAFLLHVVQRVVAVLGRQQFQVVTGHQVGFVASIDAAGNQPQVITGTEDHIGPGGEGRADL
eukprot:ctg_7191.g548